MAAALMRDDYSKRVRADFSRAAPTYDAHARLQRDVIRQGTSLLLPCLSLDATVLDAGCGTGYFKQLLKEKQIGWKTTSIDSAEGMCRKAYPAVCGDMTALPFRDGCFDAVFSSLALQWIGEPEKAFAESFRVTKKGGCAAFTTLSTRTLHELRATMQKLEMPQAMVSFPSVETIKQSATRAGWNITNCRSSLHSETYDNAGQLLRNLKGLGATYKGKAHLSPSHLTALVKHYPQRDSGSVQATFDVTLLLLVKP